MEVIALPHVLTQSVITCTGRPVLYKERPALSQSTVGPDVVYNQYQDHLQLEWA